MDHSRLELDVIAAAEHESGELLQHSMEFVLLLSIQQHVEVNPDP